MTCSTWSIPRRPWWATGKRGRPPSGVSSTASFCPGAKAKPTAQWENRPHELPTPSPSSKLIAFSPHHLSNILLFTFILFYASHCLFLGHICQNLCVATITLINSILTPWSRSPENLFHYSDLSAWFCSMKTFPMALSLLDRSVDTILLHLWTLCACLCKKVYKTAFKWAIALFVALNDSVSFNLMQILIVMQKIFCVCGLLTKAGFEDNSFLPSTWALTFWKPSGDLMDPRISDKGIPSIWFALVYMLRTHSICIYRDVQWILWGLVVKMLWISLLKIMWKTSVLMWIEYGSFILLGRKICSFTKFDSGIVSFIVQRNIFKPSVTFKMFWFGTDMFAFKTGLFFLFIF